MRPKNFVAALVAAVIILAGSMAQAATQSFSFDYGDLLLNIFSTGRVETFKARESMSVTSVEVVQNLIGRGGSFQVVVLINGQQRANWSIPVAGTVAQAYTRTLDATIDLKAGDDVSYFIYGGSSNAPVGAITGINYLKFHGEEVKDAKTFVAAFFVDCLDRSPDSVGMQYYVDALNSGSMTGANVATAFLRGDEFVAKNVPQFTFVTVLYKTLYGRDPDSDGYRYWLGQLENGASRDEVIDGFLATEEFAGYCTAHGFQP